MRLRSIQIIGDRFNGEVPSPGGWRQSDLALLESQKGMDKAKYLLSNSPFDFNIVAVMDSKHTSITGAKHWALHQLGDEFKDPTAINVIFTNNTTGKDDYMPPTAWILVHRVAHTLLITPDDKVSKGGLQEKFWSRLVPFFAKLQGLDEITGPYDQGYGQVNSGSIGNYIMHLIMTQRSARAFPNFAHRDIDFVPEMMAQYCVTGRIKFNRYADWAERREFLKNARDVKPVYESFAMRSAKGWSVEDPIKHPEVRKHMALDVDELHTPEAIDSILADLEREANVAMHELLSGMVGNVYAF